jgi:hypothetical protein
MRNRHHPVLRPAVPEDSCIAALQLANERYLQRQVTQGEGKLIGAADKAGQEPVKPSTAEVNDDDLPRIFFESTDV